MIDLRWGDHKNGRIPESALSPIGGSFSLEANAARQFLAMVAACYLATGVRLGVKSAYRTLARQVFLRLQWMLRIPGYNLAAVPGKSNHGWGKAVDLLNYERAWSWLIANAHRFGFSWETGRASGERWHWECVRIVATTATAGGGVTPIELPIEEDDETMPKLFEKTETQTLFLMDGGDFYSVPDHKRRTFVKAFGPPVLLDSDQLNSLREVVLTRRNEAEARIATLAGKRAAPALTPEQFGGLVASVQAAARSALTPEQLTEALEDALGRLTITLAP